MTPQKAMAPIDAAWRRAHPLPVHDSGTDKNGRGRVLLVAGGGYVPGAPMLTGEAALRVGAGKLQIGTIAAVTTALGVAMPEIATIPLPTDADGEIALEATEILAAKIDNIDTLIIGPGMMPSDDLAALTHKLLSVPRPELTVVLDAAALTSAAQLHETLKCHEGRVVMTPHHGEMARLIGVDVEAVSDDPEGCARKVAERFQAIVVLKAHETLIASPDGGLLHYGSDCIGLATGGSGDVLAGAIGGLMARGAAPVTAAGWGVWLHGEAGGLLSREIGPLGFLARELPAKFPGLMTD